MLPSDPATPAPRRRSDPDADPLRGAPAPGRRRPPRPAGARARGPADARPARAAPARATADPRDRDGRRRDPRRRRPVRLRLPRRPARAPSSPGTPVAAADGFQPFWDSYNTIIKRFALGGEDQQSLVNGAIKGMVDSLGDPYSAYLTPDQYRAGLQDLSGQFEGIGAEIGTTTAKGATSDCTTLGTDCVLIVVSPIEGSPAEKAGLKRRRPDRRDRRRRRSTG